MSESELQGVVIGAGVAGLAAALELRAAGWEVRLLDAALAPGGAFQSRREDGYLIERGPSTFQVKAPMRAFLQRHRAVDALLRAAPASRERYLFQDGRLLPVPMDPLAFARTPLLSGAGKRRLLREPFVPAGDGGAECVADFVRRRLGDETLERCVAPFLTGVYAGDEAQLGAASVFPGLVEHERQHGSIARGLLRQWLSGSAEPGLAGTFSSETGMGGLALRLARPLGEAVALGARVQSVRREGESHVLEVSAGGRQDSLRARSLIVASEAPAAAELLAGIAPEAAARLREIQFSPLVSLNLGVDPADVAEPISGFGFLVPRSAGLGLLGCLYMSRLFPGRAPPGREQLRCMLGGVRWPEAVDEPDDRLRAAAEGDLERVLGARGGARVLSIDRWPRAVPQPGVEHPARLADLAARLTPHPNLALAGNYLGGVSVADSLASGVAAAARVRRARR